MTIAVLISGFVFIYLIYITVCEIIKRWRNVSYHSNFCKIQLRIITYNLDSLKLQIYKSNIGYLNIIVLQIIVKLILQSHTAETNNRKTGSHVLEESEELCIIKTQETTLNNQTPITLQSDPVSLCN